MMTSYFMFKWLTKIDNLLIYCSIQDYFSEFPVEIHHVIAVKCLKQTCNFPISFRNLYSEIQKTVAQLALLLYPIHLTRCSDVTRKRSQRT